MWSPTANTLYIGLKDFAFTAALAALIFACAVRHAAARPVNLVLAWAGWNPLAKLVFGVYLVHPYVICVLFGSHHSALIYTDVFLAASMVATLGLSFAAAVVLYLLVELPCANLLSVAMGGGKRRAATDAGAAGGRGRAGSGVRA